MLPRDLLGIPVLQMGIAMRVLPTGVADALAAPLVRLTVGDITKVGLRKLPYGPNTQIKNDKHIPLLDIGTMDHIKAGRIAVHGDIERFTASGVVFDDGSSLDVDAVVLATGYRPGLEDLLPEWRAVCGDDGRPAGERRPHRAARPVVLRPVRLARRHAPRDGPRGQAHRRRRHRG